MLNNGLILLLAIVFFFSKRYCKYRFIQLYALTSFMMGYAYQTFFSDSWYYYLTMVMVEACLFSLAAWEIFYKETGIKPWWIWPVIPAILLVPILPVAFLVKVYLPFMFINIALALETPRAIRTGRPLLLVFTLASSFGLALDLLKTVIPVEQVTFVLRSIESLTNTGFMVGMMGIVLWQPAVIMVRKYILKDVRVHELESSIQQATTETGTMAQATMPDNLLYFPSPVQGSAIPQTVVIDDLVDDIEQLEPVLRTAAQMVTLSRKPFLNLTELAFYIDVSEEEAREFLDKYSIEKIFLTENSRTWVVRRLDVDYLIEEEKN
jgi:hypothetical protein